MKTKLLAAAAALVLVALVVAFVMIKRSLGEPTREIGPQDTHAQAEVTAARGAPPQLVALYARWAGRDDKYTARLQIIEALVANPDAQQALAYIIDALSRDSVPIERDPLLDEVAKRMQPLWETAYDHGRDVMLVQTNDKVRVVLAQSLVQHMRGVQPERDKEGQQRAWLTNDLVDVYYKSGPAARDRILLSVRANGASDVAKTLGGASAAELDVVQDRVHETEQAITDLHARDRDPSLQDLKAELRQTGSLNRSEIENELTATPR